MNTIQLIPDPQKIKIKSESYKLPAREWQIFSSSNIEKYFETVFKDVDLPRLFVTDKHTSDIVIEICDELELPDDIRDDLLDQAYKLDINHNRIELLAFSEQGIFYGLQTLRQLFEQFEGELPCLDITDWPESPFRGVHLNLAEENSPSFERLIQLISHMSRCKINKFTLEYDDRFPFEKHPTLIHEKALSKDQIRELIKHAKQHFIEIIPLLDSLGHAQPYLVHDEYQSLAELPGNTHEMCPSNPDTLTFIKELWSEVLELHTDCEFVHITGDEVFRLGDFCPLCKKYADENRLSELFFSYYKDLSEWMIERGKRPIMWADIALKYPDAASVMPREVIFNDWEYRGSGSKWDVTRILRDPVMTVDHNSVRDIPEINRDYFNKYYLEEDGYSFRPYPGIAILQDYGFEVIGASSASTESGKTAVPPFSIALNNNRYISKAVSENKALGVLNTYWSLYRSNIALKNGFWTGDITNAMHGIWAGGAYSWKFIEESNEQFLNRCQRIFMQSETNELSEYAKLADSIDMPEAGTYTLPPKEICSSISDFTSMSCNRDCDPIAESYMRGLEKNAAAMAEKIESSARLDANKSLEIENGKDTSIKLNNEMNSNHRSVIHMPGRNFSPMGYGEKETQGVTFNIIDPKENSGNSAVGLRGSHMPDWYESVTIEIDDKYDQLFFLNGCAYADSNEALADCKICYTDGTSVEYKFIKNENIGDWHQGKFDLPSGFPAFIWYDYGDAGSMMASYMNWWSNPYPNKKISHLELVSGEGDGYSFFFAITGRKKY